MDQKIYCFESGEQVHPVVVVKLKTLFSIMVFFVRIMVPPGENR